MNLIFTFLQQRYTLADRIGMHHDIRWRCRHHFFHPPYLEDAFWQLILCSDCSAAPHADLWCKRNPDQSEGLHRLVIPLVVLSYYSVLGWRFKCFDLSEIQDGVRPSNNDCWQVWSTKHQAAAAFLIVLAAYVPRCAAQHCKRYSSPPLGGQEHIWCPDWGKRKPKRQKKATKGVGEP